MLGHKLPDDRTNYFPFWGFIELATVFFRKSLHQKKWTSGSCWQTASLLLQALFLVTDNQKK